MPILQVEPKYRYGTAGFRMDSAELETIASRIGKFVGLLSESLGSKGIGVMITASHNPESDNGIKIIGPTGIMLDPHYEKMIESFVNSKNVEWDARETGGYLKNPKERRNVFIMIGRDTRPSGISLLKELTKGIECTGGDTTIIDMGQVTTPQMHFATFAFNNQQLSEPEIILNKYYDFINEYKILVPEKRSLSIDCAFGVGQVLLEQMKGVFDIKQSINLVGEGPLNEGCGADFVKTTKKCPVNCDCEKVGIFYSFDGDADRLVAHFIDEGGNFCLLDGDYMAAIFAHYITRESEGTSLSVAVVHTAYSNGAFLDFLKGIGIKTVCVPTGVKHLHEAAISYDIGIYFEANGHGTVLFSDKISWKDYPKLYLFKNLFNQLVGDALTDLLAVEAVLHLLHWSHKQWYSLYTERPSKLFKIQVPDKTIYKPVYSEESLDEPKQVQSQINSILANSPGSRAFVRPSGTENILRLYVEGQNLQEIKVISDEIIKLLK